MADQTPPRAHLERDPGALFRDLLDGVLVLGTRSSEPTRITSPGDAVWERLAEPQTTESLAAALSAEYGAPLDVVRADVAPVLAELMRVGAIRVLEVPPSDR